MSSTTDRIARRREQNRISMAKKRARIRSLPDNHPDKVADKQRNVVNKRNSRRRGKAKHTKGSVDMAGSDVDDNAEGKYLRFYSKTYLNALIGNIDDLNTKNSNMSNGRQVYTHVKETQKEHRNKEDHVSWQKQKKESRSSHWNVKQHKLTSVLKQTRGPLHLRQMHRKSHHLPPRKIHGPVQVPLTRRTDRLKEKIKSKRIIHNQARMKVDKSHPAALIMTGLSGKLEPRLLRQDLSKSRHAHANHKPDILRKHSRNKSQSFGPTSVHTPLESYADAIASAYNAKPGLEYKLSKEKVARVKYSHDTTTMDVEQKGGIPKLQQELLKPKEHGSDTDTQFQDESSLHQPDHPSSPPAPETLEPAAEYEDPISQIQMADINENAEQVFSPASRQSRNTSPSPSLSSTEAELLIQSTKKKDPHYPAIMFPINPNPITIEFLTGRLDLSQVRHPSSMKQLKDLGSKLTQWRVSLEFPPDFFTLRYPREQNQHALQFAFQKTEMFNTWIHSQKLNNYRQAIRFIMILQKSVNVSSDLQSEIHSLFAFGFNACLYHGLRRQLRALTEVHGVIVGLSASLQAILTRWRVDRSKFPRNILSQEVAYLEEIGYEFDIPHMGKLTAQHWSYFKPLAWVNDEVINTCIGIWKSRFQCQKDLVYLQTWFSPKFITGQDSFPPVDDLPQLLKWTKDWYQCFHQGMVLVIPINIHSNHWIVATMDTRNLTISILDSSALTPKNQNLSWEQSSYDQIFKRLHILGNKLYAASTKAEETSIEWKNQPFVNVPLQNNAYDCGIFAIFYMLHLGYSSEINGHKVPSKYHLPNLHHDLSGHRLLLMEEMGLLKTLRAKKDEAS
ncbi:hypothetical protein F5877DRAFT_78658 [Lentinula edodes]|nr:hypothetical protein F5877DRAFT_78658 [Lentinula edodes]